MSSKQTRRSISVSGELYATLKAYAEASNGSQSGLVEEVMRRHFQMEPRDRKRPSKKKPEPRVKAKPEALLERGNSKAKILGAVPLKLRPLNPDLEESESEAANAMRWQIKQAAQVRAEKIKAAADRQCERDSRDVESASGIFTF